MKRTRQLTAVLLAALLLLSLCLPMTVSAADAVTPDELRSIDGLSALEETLYLGLMNTAASIDVSRYAATEEEVSAAMQHLQYAAGELFHMSVEYSFFTDSYGYVTDVEPTYLMTGAALATARSLYKTLLDDIAATVDPTWSDYEICLYLHDYLAVHYTYDDTYEIYDAYNFLVEGTGVCQSYTLTYSALLSYFDIPVSYCTGYAGEDHIWSLVKLGGRWYHVDTTWGDPYSGDEAFGSATHDNFLKSDAAIEATGHEQCENYGGIVCNDTRYDEAAISLIEQGLVMVGGNAYGIRDGKIYRFSDDLLTAELVTTVEGTWDAGDGYVYQDVFSGLGGGNGVLYYNDPTRILEYDLATGLSSPVLTVDEGQIVGLYTSGGEILYQVAADTALSELSVKAYPISTELCTGEHTYVEYNQKPATCETEGISFVRCSVCSHKTTRAIPTLPHNYKSTVVPPSIGVAGYTRHVCRDCEYTMTDTPTEALPLPLPADYKAAVARAAGATTAEDFVAAAFTAKAMEPYLEDGDIAAEKAQLASLLETYGEKLTATNKDFGRTVTDTVRMDAGLLSSSVTLLALLILVVRRRFGIWL